MSLSHITITSTTLFTLAAALFVGACDEHATEPTEPTEQVADASPVFHYLGERFTLDELGEAPPHLVFVSADEVHGFDSVEEADEFLRAHAASRHHAANHAPMRLFELIKPGKRRAQAHLLGIARINTGHQRFHHPFAGMPPKPATKKRRERFIFRGTPRWNQQITPHPGQVDP